jgi:hypothetical protein
MEFKGQYLTYQEYLTLGGTLDEMPFNLLEYNARKEIDSRTQKRFIGIGNEYEEVKLCVYNLIPVIQSYDTTQNKTISSENIDGYSISYGTPQKSFTEAKNSELDDVIYKYLYGVIVNGEHALFIGQDKPKNEELSTC